MPTDGCRRTPPCPTRTRFEPERVLADDGTAWPVFEVSYEYDRRAGRSLIFEHQHAWRRVRRYPANWHQLPKAELLKLLSAT